jgi:ribonuclease P protein component
MLYTGETFHKSERLCSKKIIEALFENGKSFYCNPFLIVWSYTSEEITFPAQVAFSVPKKTFRHAVTRNMIKRRMREAYRKNKALLYNHLSSAGKRIVFTIIYRDKEVSDYAKTEKGVKQIVSYFVNVIDISKPNC